MSLTPEDRLKLWGFEKTPEPTFDPAVGHEPLFREGQPGHWQNLRLSVNLGIPFGKVTGKLLGEVRRDDEWLEHFESIRAVMKTLKPASKLRQQMFNSILEQLQQAHNGDGLEPPF